MVVSRGEIWCVDLGDPVASGPGYVRPAVIVSGDTFNRSNIATVIVVPLTSNLRHANLPGGVIVRSKGSGLPKISVANATQVATVGTSQLRDPIGVISRSETEALDHALRQVLAL